MTNDTRTADEIEREIENERSQMSGTINDLQRKFSVEGIVDDVRSLWREQGGEFGRMVTQTVGRNPAAVVLTSVGLAWLLIGQFSQPATPRPDNRSYGGRSPGGARFEPRPDSGFAERDTAQWRGQTAGIAPHYRADRQGRDAMGLDRSWIDDDWDDMSQGGMQHNPDVAGRAGTFVSMSDTMDDTGGGIGGKVTEAVKGAATSVRDTVSGLSERLLQGTEEFSDEAKARVLQARQAAYDAKDAAGAALKAGGQTAANLFEDQPLVVGALAVALGAAIGGALPHTRTEDKAMGPSRESLFAEAQRIFAEERTKAMSVLRVATDTAKQTLSEVASDVSALVPEGKTATSAVVDRMTGAASQVLDSARTEADRQGLGQRTD